MKCTRLVLAATGSILLMTGLGCANHYAPPPPPPPYAQVPPLFQIADRNGFQTGRADGNRDANYGYRYAPRRTPAYHVTPGYDPQLGPFGPYRSAFRSAYLRGYDAGYYRR